ncbi:NUDIX hydrolase [Gammaproteobacteria bacterium]|nr:NUDIX hydrolase [Gammaproteobacteria bacterium]MDA7845160.1 NUDIX hydrolase [Gammaproteobacteria bacterium]MDA7851446.1 NUDIX hydrolase [Gammaproteobacteria bacterium]MDA8933693.1 NUDIX hydrolase [Gammaproteobacteria bacterium]MDA9039775.1 NUDIX hydrolase [Gammaproteobacteria bacterium]
MKYCSDCGSSNIEFKTPQGDNIKRYCCPDCNNIFYTNPNMIVGAICIRDNKILLAKRNIHPRKGLWTLPAGFMENAETLKVGALRETMEETMSEASVVMPYTMFSLPHINQVHLFYLADLLDDNFGPTSESIEVKLFSEDEIPWDEIAFPTVERTLKLYLEDVKTGDFIFRDEDINLW